MIGKIFSVETLICPVFIVFEIFLACVKHYAISIKMTN